VLAPLRSLCALALGLSLLPIGGCARRGASTVASPPAPAASAPVRVAPATVLEPSANSNWDHSQAKVPVTWNDPIWGHADAPVTIVEFTDYECPFCSRVTETLDRIRSEYGPAKVRIVTLHNPLPFHKQALPAAVAATAVFQLAGPYAFYRFTSMAFQHQRELSDENYVSWAKDCGIDPQAFRKALDDGRAKQKVEADLALGKQLGATGTPAFRINGVTLVGAQPFEKFADIINEQLVQAEKLVRAGTAPKDVYVALTNRNVENPAPAPERKPSPPADDDTTVYRIPVMADDPVLGPLDAPVTIVIFSDFQCPFCKRVEGTLKAVREHYGNNVRLVWKDQPLPFHPQAMPAAILGRLVYSQKGNHAFWSLHDELFAAQPFPDDAKLEAVAKKFGVSWASVQSAQTGGRMKERVEASQNLANDFNARGTPHFFINGFRLSGAQPFENFQARIDSELEKAKALRATGIKPAKLYEELTKIGKGPPEPERKAAPLPPAGRPSRGPANAPVVIQEWSDFQCPFCARVEPTLVDLQKEFPTQVRLVWRHMPLPFHDKAPLAAEAAEEALAQRGPQAFWKYHDRLFEAQSEPDGLSKPNLVKIAEELNLNATRFEAALEHHDHKNAVEADAKLADSLEISGAPAFIINGYYVSGAQPLSAFRRAVTLALADAKSGKATARRAVPEPQKLKAAGDADSPSPEAAPAAVDVTAAPADVAQAPKDATRSASGLASKVLKRGTGKLHPKAADTVVVDYTGWTKDGKVFDSSLTRHARSSFGVAQVIPGWTEALQLMVVGEKRRVWIPARLAYGENPMAGAPAGDLVFDVELHTIIETPQAPDNVSAPPSSAKKTATGIAYVVLRKGSGAVHPTLWSRVKVHYTGWTTDGKMFDSSLTRAEPAIFGLEQVIAGWTEGVQLMVVGEKTRFWIPSELAYGNNPRPGAPVGMLVFDIELLEIQ